MSTQNVTLTVEDQNTDPVEGVTLELRRTHDDSIVTTGVTDSSGQVVVSLLLNGEYYVLGSRALLTFARQVVTVIVDPDPDEDEVGVPQSFTLVSVVPAITLPTAALLCKVYGFFYPSSSNPTVTIERDTGIRVGGGTGYSDLNERISAVVSAHPERGGIWEADLVRGAVYTVSIPRLAFQRRIRVPSQSTANIEDILAMLGSVDLVPST